MDAPPESGGGVEGRCVEKGGREKEKRGEEEKQVPQSYRAGASIDSKGGKEGRGIGRDGGEGETLVKLSTDA